MVFSWKTESAQEVLIRTPLLPTENFENSFEDGIMTLNIFELPTQGDGNINPKNEYYSLFLSNLKSRLMEICSMNQWLLGRLEQIRSISITSPINGDFELVSPKELTPAALEARVLDEVMVEAPEDLPWVTIDGSPLLDLARFVQSLSLSTTGAGGKIDNKSNCCNQLSARVYQDLSMLLKRIGSTTHMGRGPELAKSNSPLFKVVVLPTPNKSHVFVIVTLSHAIADGNTYHRLLHMLFQSMDRKTNERIPSSKLICNVQDIPTEKLDFEVLRDIEALSKRYKKERDAVVPEAKLLDQIKLGLDIGRIAIKEQLKPEDRALHSFVALVNQDEVNRLKKEHAALSYREAVLGPNPRNKKLFLSTNDILVCEISKILNVDRMDTNMDVRMKVLHGRMGFDKDIAVDAAGNFVAMLPFKRPHFENPWYVRKAMTRDDEKFYADPIAANSKDNNNVTGNLSNWSGFTVGTKLGGDGILLNDAGGSASAGNRAAKLVLHLPINVTADGNTPFEQALIFCPFQNQAKQLAVVISTHRYHKVLDRMEQQQLLIPFRA